MPLTSCLPLCTIVNMQKSKAAKAAQLLGRRGGQARAQTLTAAELSKIATKGGKARAAKLSPAERSKAARKAVQARIRKYGQTSRKEEE